MADIKLPVKTIDGKIRPDNNVEALLAKQLNTIEKQLKTTEQQNKEISNLISRVGDLRNRNAGSLSVQSQTEEQIKQLQLEKERIALETAKLNFQEREKLARRQEESYRKTNTSFNRVADKITNNKTYGAFTATGLSLMTGGVINPVFMQKMLPAIGVMLKGAAGITGNIAGGIFNLFKHSNKKSNATESVVDKYNKNQIVSRLDAIIHELQKEKAAIKDITKEHGGGLFNKLIRGLFNFASPLLKAALTAIAGWALYKLLEDQIKQTWNKVKEHGEKFWKKVTAFAEHPWESIKSLAEEYWPMIQEFGKGAWEEIKNIASDTWEGIKWLGLKTWEGIGFLAEKTWNWIKTTASDMWDGTKKLAVWAWNGIKSIASKSWEWITEKASKIWNGIKELAVGAWNKILEFGSYVWNAIGGIASKAWNWISEQASKIWNNVSTWGKEGWTAIKNTALNVWDNVKDVAASSWEWVTEKAGKIWESIKAFAKSSWEWVKNKAIGVWDWFASIVGPSWNWITEKAGGVWDWITNKFADLFGWLMGDSDKPAKPQLTSYKDTNKLNENNTPLTDTDTGLNTFKASTKTTKDFTELSNGYESSGNSQVSYENFKNTQNTLNFELNTSKRFKATKRKKENSQLLKQYFEQSGVTYDQLEIPEYSNTNYTETNTVFLNNNLDNIRGIIKLDDEQFKCLLLQIKETNFTPIPVSYNKQNIEYPLVGSVDSLGYSE